MDSTDRPSSLPPRPKSRRELEMEAGARRVAHYEGERARTAAIVAAREGQDTGEANEAKEAAGDSKAAKAKAKAEREAAKKRAEEEARAEAEAEMERVTRAAMEKAAEDAAKAAAADAADTDDEPL